MSTKSQYPTPVNTSRFSMDQLFKIFVNSKDQVYSAKYGNSVLEYFEKTSVKKMEREKRPLAELLTKLLSDEYQNESLKTILLGKYSQKWIPVVTASFPKHIKEIIKYTVSCGLFHESADLQLASCVFLSCLVKLYPKRAQSVFDLVMKMFKKATQSEQTENNSLNLKAVKTMMQELAVYGKMWLDVLASLRSSLLLFTKHANTQNSILHLRTLVQEMLMWSEVLIGIDSKNDKNQDNIIRIVQFMLKAHEYLEMTLSPGEYAPMFISLRRVTVDLASTFGVFYPTRALACRLLIGFQNASKTVTSRTSSTFDVRLSKSERRCGGVARLLKADLVKSMMREKSQIECPMINQDTVEGKILNSNGLLPRLLNDFKEQSQMLVKNATSPLDLYRSSSMSLSPSSLSS